jgi:hypothetical protein
MTGIAVFPSFAARDYVINAMCKLSADDEAIQLQRWIAGAEVQEHRGGVAEELANQSIT